MEINIRNVITNTSMTEVFRLGVTDNNTYAYLQDIKIPERW